MKKILPIAFIIALSGCAQQSFAVRSGDSNQSPKVITHHFLISGLGQGETIDAAAVCNGQDKVVKVESQHTFINGVLAAISFGVYTPREARVYCAA